MKSLETRTPPTVLCGGAVEEKPLHATGRVMTWRHAGRELRRRTSLHWPSLIAVIAVDF